MDLIIAVILDLIIGDPEKLPHPVRLFGKVITLEEKLVRRLARTNRHFMLGGFMIVLINLLLSLYVPFLILRSLEEYEVLYHIVNIYMLYSVIAARCLCNEAIKIYKALDKSLEEARYRLSFIVGRDTDKLSEHEITRATVETVAENTSDGVIAPLLFAMIGGAPLAYLYKMANTMDSMLGYMNEKYRFIGYYPAKIDDVFNYIPARLTGLLMILSNLLRYDGLNGLKVMLRDRKNHKSPNCAYPEGAAAGLLGVQLGGSNYYFGELIPKPTIGDFKRKLERKDIIRVIEIMFKAEILLVIIYIVIEVSI